MNGVEILTSAQVATEWANNWGAFWIVFGIIAVISFVVGVIKSFLEDDFGYAIINIIIGVLGGITFGLLAAVVCETPTAHETQYKVTISDKVSMVDFCEHYEVIDQDGKIFTVREKTNE